MCFNLFGELAEDLPLASRVLRRMTDGRIRDVTAIRFEHSPGRRDRKYTGDRSAFDVFIEYTTPAAQRGFAGIEVKYHEGLGDQPAPHRDRYDEIATAMGCFHVAALERLRRKPVQQIWRDHLLAGSLLQDREVGFIDGFFAFLRPKDNENCARAVEMYAACLATDATFVSWTLEGFVGAIKAECAGEWVRAFERRYLAFEALDAL